MGDQYRSNQENLIKDGIEPEAAKAIAAWYENHNGAEEWKPVWGCFFKQLPMIVQHNKTDVTPWCVQYAGNGHYFTTESEAYEWIAKRMTRG